MYTIHFLFKLYDFNLILMTAFRICGYCFTVEIPLLQECKRLTGFGRTYYAQFLDFRFSASGHLHCQTGAVVFGTVFSNLKKKRIKTAISLTTTRGRL